MAKVLVTGATGYIGGRLIPLLLERGESLRCLVRDETHAAEKSWRHQVNLVQADVLEDDLSQVLEGIDTAYYLIHSMSKSEQGFEDRDRQAAENFARAAKAAGVKHIIYLGGLGEGDMSKHLKSRQETGEMLASTGLNVTEFRAAIIVGSGSISFEMIRYLTERLPIMITPTWVKTRVQPIAVRNVLQYLFKARDLVPEGHQVVEIGGPDVLTYKDLMLIYARLRGLTRVMIPVPVLSPRLSSYWVNLITPIPGAIARPLVDGLQTEVVVNHPEAAKAYDVEPLSYETAVKLALDRTRQGSVDTLWSESFYEPSRLDDPTRKLEDKEGMLYDRQVRRFPTTQDNAFRAVARLGGEQGWPPFDWLWKLRGLLDRLFGGTGMRRGRRHPEKLVEGDVLDFWLVESVNVPNHLQLLAEMRLPGRGWLRFDLSACEDGSTEVRQTAFYEPHGLFGYLYWWSVYPFHLIIFPGMLAAIERQAIELEQAPPTETALQN